MEGFSICLMEPAEDNDGLTDGNAFQSFLVFGKDLQSAVRFDSAWNFGASLMLWMSLWTVPMKGSSEGCMGLASLENFVEGGINLPVGG